MRRKGLPSPSGRFCRNREFFPRSGMPGLCLLAKSSVPGEAEYFPGLIILSGHVAGHLWHQLGSVASDLRSIILCKHQKGASAWGVGELASGDVNQVKLQTSSDAAPAPFPQQTNKRDTTYGTRERIIGRTPGSRTPTTQWPTTTTSSRATAPRPTTSSSSLRRTRQACPRAREHRRRLGTAGMGFRLRRRTAVRR